MVDLIQYRAGIPSEVVDQLDVKEFKSWLIVLLNFIQVWRFLKNLFYIIAINCYFITECSVHCERKYWSDYIIEIIWKVWFPSLSLSIYNIIPFFFDPAQYLAPPYKNLTAPHRKCDITSTVECTLSENKQIIVTHFIRKEFKYSILYPSVTISISGCGVIDVRNWGKEFPKFATLYHIF